MIEVKPNGPRTFRHCASCTCLHEQQWQGRCVASEVKPTLAGLAEALNTLLANGVDPNSEVSMGTYEDESDGFIGSLVFDGVVDVETVGGQGPMLRVIISSDADYEVLSLGDLRRFHCRLTCEPRSDGSCACSCPGCRGAPGKVAKWKAAAAGKSS